MPYVYLASSFTDLLKDIFYTIFEEVLSPVLRSVFNVILELLGDYIWGLFSDILLDGLIILLKLVAFLENMFSVFSGLATVSVSEAGGGKSQTSLLSFLFQMDGLSRAFAVISLMAAILAFMFSMYATGKAMADLPFEDRQAPISAVLKNGLKSAITFLIIPVMSLFLLELSGAVLDQVVITFQSAYQTENSGMDDVLFITAAQEAAKKDTDLEDFGQGHKYQNRDTVKKYFNIEDIDYVIGYISCLLMLLILLGACLSFIRRLFELLILYLISPFFAATIALDGGSRFRHWKDLFIAKFFSGFGAIFAMKIYLMAAPLITGDSLVFSSNSSIDSCIKIFLVIGGAWAVYKGQNTFLEILSPEAAGAVNQSITAITAMVSGVGKAKRGNRRQGGK